MAKHPGQKKNKYGVVHAIQGIFRRAGKTFYSLADVLSEEFNSCQPCGCDPCLGGISQIDVETGELVVIFVEDGTLVTMPYDSGKEYLKNKQKQR